jgi:hypothetical protein
VIEDKIENGNDHTTLNNNSSENNTKIENDVEGKIDNDFSTKNNGLSELDDSIDPL